MANLEVSIGADNSELLKKIDQTEKEIKKLEKQEQILIKAGLDTSGLNTKIKEAKGNLDGLRTSLNNTSKSFEGASKSTANAGNTLINFSRIAQDAPFGIMGIGNNLTSTAEAFSSLSKQAGGAGGALKALGSSLMGGGGVLLAISLVTTALTVMSQQGLTVGDVFNKLSGNFNQFKKDLSDVNKEAAKNAAEEVQRVRALAEVAKDETLTRQKRLVAVQKLQEEYPAYFGNLTKEKILNGNVGTSIRDVVEAIKEKARAQALSGKLGELASKEFELREKEADLIEKSKEAIKKKAELEKKLSSEQFNEQTFKSLQQVTRALDSYQSDLKDTKASIGEVISETNKWASASAKATGKSILLEFKPEKAKKAQKQLHDQLTALRPEAIGLDSLVKTEPNLLVSDTEMGKMFDAFIYRLGHQAKPIGKALREFFTEINSTLAQSLNSTLGNVGDAIGQALVQGTSVIKAIGSSLLSSLGSLLSAIGDKLIALGTSSLITTYVTSTFGTLSGTGAAVAAIAAGTALKIGGSYVSGMGDKVASSGGSASSGSPSYSAGNSVSSPTSSVNTYSTGGSLQNVVFEISGQSLVGVLSNTLNKNTKLGGASPAI